MRERAITIAGLAREAPVARATARRWLAGKQVMQANRTVLEAAYERLGGVVTRASLAELEAACDALDARVGIKPTTDVTRPEDEPNDP